MDIQEKPEMEKKWIFLENIHFFIFSRFSAGKARNGKKIDIFEKYPFFSIFSIFGISQKYPFFSHFFWGWETYPFFSIFWGGGKKYIFFYFFGVGKIYHVFQFFLGWENYHDFFPVFWLI